MGVTFHLVKTPVFVGLYLFHKHITRQSVRASSAARIKRSYNTTSDTYARIALGKVGLIFEYTPNVAYPRFIEVPEPKHEIWG
jgi:hypothetical protein